MSSTRPGMPVPMRIWPLRGSTRPGAAAIHFCDGASGVVAMTGSGSATLTVDVVAFWVACPGLA